MRNTTASRQIVRVVAAVIFATLLFCIQASYSVDLENSDWQSEPMQTSVGVDDADPVVVAVNTSRPHNSKEETAIVPNAQPSIPQKTGTIRGRVIFDGTPPQRELLIVGKPRVDPQVCGQVEHFEEHMLVSPSNNGVKNVFVYLARGPKFTSDSRRPLAPVKIMFKNCRIEPRCIVVQTQQEFQMHSEDPIPHNLVLIPEGNDLGSLPSPWIGKPVCRSFKDSESRPFPITCKIHPWIEGWILVTDHPFAAITDAKGNFEIPNVPYGEHRFRMFHERGKMLARRFSITVDAELVEVPEFSFEPSIFGL